jgi:Tfp pilus assembly protein PilF
MLYEIVTMTNIQESEKLTELALMEINSKNFETAFSHLEKAIILDPENTRARDTMYL